LIFRRERSTFAETEEYIFKHALLRDVTYETVLLKLRRVYHRQVAAWLEAAAGERLGEYLGLIAGHYELAGDAAKAVTYLLRAGDRARLAYAHQEAVEYYRRALVFLKEQGEHGRAARTLMKIGLVYHTAFDYQHSRQAYEEGFALWRRAEEIQPSAPLTSAPHALRALREAPLILDPTMTDHIGSGVPIIQLFSGLLEGSVAMEAMPDVARSWELSADGRRYVFHLRDDVRWSDGAPVTAGDFEYAWKRVLDPASGSPNTSLLYDIKGARAFHQGEASDPGSVGVRALDDLTLVVELEGPTGYFLSLLAHYATYPVPRHVLEVQGEAWSEISNIVTNGAFNLEAWNRGKSMILARNPEYHGRFKGNLKRVELSFGVEKSVVLEMYEAGNLDILGLVDLQPSEWDRARRRHAGEYVSAPESATHYVGFDVSRPPFDDRRVRQAFALATDKTTLVDVVLGGYLFPATGGFVPPGVAGHSAGIGLPYDPEQARRLLADAGYPGGRGFPIVDACARESMRPQAEYLQEQWKCNLGVEISWKIMRWNEYLARLEIAPAHIVQFTWIADYPDPDSFLRTGNIQQRTHWRNENYDKLVDKARRVLDQEERLELYAQADRILIEAAATIPLTYSRSHVLVKPWVRKFPASALNQWLWKDIIIEAH
jgi:ABC-type oligopeptide transport system substrate-binding subunit